MKGSGRFRLGLMAGLSLLALAAAGAAAAAPALDVPYVPTRQETVEEMLRMAQVSEKDVLYDLGSGDGRIVVTAAKQYGVRGTGVDLDPDRIAEARENARQAGVEDRVRFIQGDLFDTDFSAATVLTMYLLPEVNMKLRPRILAMPPGMRVVSHAFDMEDWQPDASSRDSGQTVYLWIVPARLEGDWAWQVGEGDQARRYQLSLTQDFQEISGTAMVNDRPARIQEASVRGDRLTLSIQPEGGEPVRFSARYENGRLLGQAVQGAQVAAEQTQWVARRAGAQRRG